MCLKSLNSSHLNSDSQNLLLWPPPKVLLHLSASYLLLCNSHSSNPGFPSHPTPCPIPRHLALFVPIYLLVWFFIWRLFYLSTYPTSTFHSTWSNVCSQNFSLGCVNESKLSTKIVNSQPKKTMKFLFQPAGGLWFKKVIQKTLSTAPLEVKSLEFLRQSILHQSNMLMGFI